ncbi:MAG: hypothetical protein AB7I50_00480 [Vicinamibacterales bacterium]
MAFDAHKNMASSTVATAPSPADSGTSLVVAAGEGARFPAVPFNATVKPINASPTPANSEIVRVTNISTDTLTIVRAQETGAGGPSARTILVGDQIAATITVKTITDIELWQPIPQDTAATGAQHNFDLDGPNVDLFCTGAAPSFSGFTVQGGAPYAGCRVRIWTKGTTIKVTNEDTNSTAANRIVTPSAAGQITGAYGMIEATYDDVSDRWRIAVVEPGAAIDIAFASGNFTASAGNFTLTSPDQVVFRYIQIGNNLDLEFNFNNTTVSATPTGLRFELTGTTGFTVSGRLLILLAVDDAGTVTQGRIDFNSSVSYVQVSKLSGSWTTSTDTTSFSGRFTIAIQ